MSGDLQIEIEQTGDGLLLPVQAQPRARRNAVTGMQAGRLKVAVTQAPDKGRANAGVLHVLAGALQLKRSQLRLAGGAASRKKRILVTGITVDELCRRISDCLADGPSR